ncbi:MAG: radical SAM protein [Spirochaetes bacterium]|nr:radical SAM protein [Spirochaetota bacterium]
MNNIRAEENALLIWNMEAARTAYISGEELAVLERWAHGEKNENNGFIDRLKTLGLITDDCKQAIKDAAISCRSKKSPANSFYAPESLHIELTGQCPLNCPTCYKPATQESLPLDFLSDLLRQAQEMQVFQIALGGGEPLIYPHLTAVIQEIRRLGMASSVTTSGVTLTGAKLAELKTAGLNHIQISLNGSNKVVHSKSRNGFEHGINALEILRGFNYDALRQRIDSDIEPLNVFRETGISYGINWIARADNIDDFPQFMRLAKNYQAHNVNILRYKPSPKEDYAQNELSARQFLQLAKYVRERKNGKLNLKLDSAFSNLRCIINGRTSFMSGCGAGRRFIAVDSSGFYRPCSHVPMREQPQDLHTLRTVWHESKNLEMFRNLQSRIEQPCATCDYLQGCYGCRAISLAQSGGFYAGAKGCAAEVPI